MEHGLSDVFVLVVALGVISQWLAWRFQFPAIILLSVAGLLAGPVFGLIHPDEAFGEEGLRTIISLGVAVILFEGGLNLRRYELKEAANGVQRLVTLGAAFNFVLASAAAHYVGALSWPVSLVTGAILVVTGPTVIMPLLRQAMLNRRTASYLKWEAIINDPIGALLAVLVFQYFVFSGIEATLEGVILDLGKAVGVALALGGGGGWLLVQAFRRAHVPEFLKAPVLLAAVFSV
ncbi:MAG TPA: cation:proton antiporter, partial [Gammaproteobacteria bacterium]|nr:cation:proton antiporter [Gammaproteobacteria bacterium]